MMEVGSNMISGAMMEDIEYDINFGDDDYAYVFRQVKYLIYELKELRDSLDRTIPENLIRVECLNDEIRRLKCIEFAGGENVLGEKVVR